MLLEDNMKRLLSPFTLSLGIITYSSMLNVLFLVMTSFVNLSLAALPPNPRNVAT